MPVTCYDVPFPRLSEADLEAWKEIPAAVASDCLDRGQAMAGAISPLAPDMHIVAQAVTVACMVSDNSALHAAIGSDERKHLHRRSSADKANTTPQRRVELVEGSDVLKAGRPRADHVERRRAPYLDDRRRRAGTRRRARHGRLGRVRSGRGRRAR